MDAHTLVANLRELHRTGRTRSLEWRLTNLKACRTMLNDNIESWTAAVVADTLKPRAEALLADVWVAQQEINTMISSLQAWAAPEDVSTPVLSVTFCCCILFCLHRQICP